MARTSLEVRTYFWVAKLQLVLLTPLQVVFRRRITMGLRLVRLGRSTSPVRFVLLVVPPVLADEIPEDAADNAAGQTLAPGANTSNCRGGPAQ